MDCGGMCGQIAGFLRTGIINNTIVALSLSIVIALSIGVCISDFVRKIQKNLVHNLKILEKGAKDDKTKTLINKWIAVIEIGKLTNPTELLGNLEIFFFYFCLFFRPEGIVAWLVFKTAAKWDTWANIIKVPDKIKVKNIEADGFEYLELRNKFGTAVMQKFLIGTIGNMLAAFIGFVSYHIIKCL